ncbi:MAG: hypothetical protein Q7S81_02995 [bacterium]|nr:hypothetical protein [bacterium]
MKYNRIGSQKQIRSNKDSARFAEAFENAVIRHSKMSMANIAFKVMSGEGCLSYKTDLEFAGDLDSFRKHQSPANAAELALSFGSGKIRTVDQAFAIGKVLRRALKHHPDLTIGAVLGEVAMGKNYCSYHKDEDMIKMVERF